MNTKIVDPLPAGAFTMNGKTTGPALNLGRNRYNKSQMVYMHLDELRDAVVNAGWHTEADYQKLLAERDELADGVMHFQGALAEANEKIETLEAALGWKPKENTRSGKTKQRATESTSV